MSSQNPNSHEGGIGKEIPLHDRFCKRPFVHAELYQNGDVYTCCPAWISGPIGNFRDASLVEIWDSSAAREMRDSIRDGSFRMCNRDWCPEIQSGRLPKLSELEPEWKEIHRTGVPPSEFPETLLLSYDETCNLSCPSCRPHKISYRRGSSELKLGTNFTEQLVDDLYRHPEKKVELHMAGSGDPLASHIFRDLLETLDSARLPNLGIYLKTNAGLLTPRMYERIRKALPSIRTIIVSIDAATPETYAIVRRGGNWPVLLRNLEHLVREKVHFPFRLNACFVAQQRNFKETGAFARYFLDLGFDEIHYLLVDDFGAWGSQENYFAQCVWRKDHLQFGEFMEALKDPILSDSRVLLGNLAEYRRAALGIRISQNKGHP